MMEKYITVEQAKKTVDYAVELSRSDWEKVVDAFDDLPTADVEEVVRCRDCRFWHTKLCWAKHDPSKNDFCSFGTKMDGGKE